MHPFTTQLLDAITTGNPVPRTTATPPQTPAESEAIQSELIAALGGIGAWKVSPWSPGATMTAAPIPKAWVHQSAETVDLSGLRFEVEFALVVAGDGSFRIAPALEFIRSRTQADAEWPAAAKHADLLVTGGLVLGTPQPLPPAYSEIAVAIQLLAGDESQTLTTNLSVSDLLEAARWTSEYASRIGLPFTPGTVIITGARLGPIELAANHIRAELDSFGAVEIFRAGAQ
ncbi:hypothetical protein [Devosia sp. 1635]|uniref:hypothetical protein n=2 Tax=unclassified Devosia TaxID=196773 RepID=UPI001565D08A|nr:hypothetical protein [Devosia sp. 1635]